MDGSWWQRETSKQARSYWKNRHLCTDRHRSPGRYALDVCRWVRFSLQVFYRSWVICLWMFVCTSSTTFRFVACWIILVFPVEFVEFYNIIVIWISCSLDVVFIKNITHYFVRNNMESFNLIDDTVSLFTILSIKPLKFKHASLIKFVCTYIVQESLKFLFS